MEFDRFVAKGWGYEKWIVNSALYCGKILHFVKGRKCSLHYHKLKTETFYVLFGRISIVCGDSKEIEKNIDFGLNPMAGLSVKILEAGDYFLIVPGLAHMIEAEMDSEIIEFSTQHFEEDSYRILKGD